MNDRRVVITGMGVVTVLGQSLTEYSASLKAGRSGITHWKDMDRRIYSKIGGDMGDFDVQDHLASYSQNVAPIPEDLQKRAQKLLRATPLSGRITSMAALQAAMDAGLLPDREPGEGIAPERFGHVMGGHNLTVKYYRDNVEVFEDEPEFLDPLFGVLCLDTDVLSVTSELLNLQGPSYTVGGACASGNLALLSGLQLVRSGAVEAVAVSGGASDCDPITLQGWTQIEALSFKSFNDEPERASRPFDVRREGFVPSEGSAVVILESYESARARGAHIWGELLGAASASDASRLPKPSQLGQVRVMQLALQDAGVDPDQIDYVNAHATSTPLGDAMEVMAIQEVLGARAKQIPVNATKSMLGHCLTAASLAELVALVLQMNEDYLHPTINLEEQDPELDLDFVANEARDHRFDIAISNAFGFGGLNSCVVVGRKP
ncbi:MAG: beta-ketoacyl-[acyl-carrier-protein] synthase family protein [Myxococcota bacterium]